MSTSRRDIFNKSLIFGSSLLVSGFISKSPIVLAEDSRDLTSALFNEDGSIRDEANIDREAKFRSVESIWNTDSAKFLINVDGRGEAGVDPGSKVRVGYSLPMKWGVTSSESSSTEDTLKSSRASSLYGDRSIAGSPPACERITMYQAPAVVTIDRLEQAPSIGVAKALYVTDDLSELAKADLIGGRTSTREGQKYFDFDMALAPTTCGQDKDNLGLGFCPFDTIYLLSATVLDDRLYVFSLKCNKDEWKRANSDLKAVRSKFRVEQL
jgi:hypothetical protein